MGAQFSGSEKEVALYKRLEHRYLDELSRIGGCRKALIDDIDAGKRGADLLRSFGLYVRTLLVLTASKELEVWPEPSRVVVRAAPKWNPDAAIIFYDKEGGSIPVENVAHTMGDDIASAIEMAARSLVALEGTDEAREEHGNALAAAAQLRGKAT